MPELRYSEVQIMILRAKHRQIQRDCFRPTDEMGGILTPTHAASVFKSLRIGTMCLPFVTELSRLGLKASPENSVIKSG